MAFSQSTGLLWSTQASNAIDNGVSELGAGRSRDCEIMPMTTDPVVSENVDLRIDNGKKCQRITELEAQLAALTIKSRSENGDEPTAVEAEVAPLAPVSLPVREEKSTAVEVVVTPPTQPSSPTGETKSSAAEAVVAPPTQAAPSTDATKAPLPEQTKAPTPPSPLRSALEGLRCAKLQAQLDSLKAHPYREISDGFDDEAEDGGEGEEDDDDDQDDDQDDPPRDGAGRIRAENAHPDQQVEDCRQALAGMTLGVPATPASHLGLETCEQQPADVSLGVPATPAGHQELDNCPQKLAVVSLGVPVTPTSGQELENCRQQSADTSPGVSATPAIDQGLVIPTPTRRFLIPVPRTALRAVRQTPSLVEPVVPGASPSSCAMEGIEASSTVAVPPPSAPRAAATPGLVPQTAALALPSNASAMTSAQDGGNGDRMELDTTEVRGSSASINQAPAPSMQGNSNGPVPPQADQAPASRMLGNTTDNADDTTNDVDMADDEQQSAAASQAPASQAPADERSTGQSSAVQAPAEAMDETWDGQNQSQTVHQGSQSGQTAQDSTANQSGAAVQQSSSTKRDTDYDLVDYESEDDDAPAAGSAPVPDQDDDQDDDSDSDDDDEPADQAAPRPRASAPSPSPEPAYNPWKIFPAKLSVKQRKIICDVNDLGDYIFAWNESLGQAMHGGRDEYGNEAPDSDEDDDDDDDEDEDEDDEDEDDDNDDRGNDNGNHQRGSDHDDEPGPSGGNNGDGNDPDDDEDNDDDPAPRGQTKDQSAGSRGNVIPNEDMNKLLQECQNAPRGAFAAATNQPTSMDPVPSMSGLSITASSQYVPSPSPAYNNTPASSSHTLMGAKAPARSPATVTRLAQPTSQSSRPLTFLAAQPPSSRRQQFPQSASDPSGSGPRDEGDYTDSESESEDGSGDQDQHMASPPSNPAPPTQTSDNAAAPSIQQAPGTRLQAPLRSRRQFASQPTTGQNQASAIGGIPIPESTPLDWETERVEQEALMQRCAQAQKRLAKREQERLAFLERQKSKGR